MFGVVGPATYVVRGFYTAPIRAGPSPVMVYYSQCWYVHSCKTAARRAEDEVRIFARPCWGTRSEPDIECANNIQERSAKSHICTINRSGGNECVRRKYLLGCGKLNRDREIRRIMQQQAPTAIVNTSARESVKDIVQE